MSPKFPQLPPFNTQKKETSPPNRPKIDPKINQNPPKNLYITTPLQNLYKTSRKGIKLTPKQPKIHQKPLQNLYKTSHNLYITSTSTKTQKLVFLTLKEHKNLYITPPS